MNKQPTRDILIQTGRSVMFQTGYNGSSVRDISRAADVPLGSFTNHFRSKEGFASAVLASYFEYVSELVDFVLSDTSKPPLERLRSYFQLISSKLANDDWTRGCLIGDFSIEASTQSELLRSQLSEIFKTWRQPFAHCIAEAQASKKLPLSTDPEELADFLLTSWEGAILRMKVERSAEPLNRFCQIMFETTFREREL